MQGEVDTSQQQGLRTTFSQAEERTSQKLPLTAEGGDRLDFQKSLTNSATFVSLASAVPQVEKGASPGIFIYISL